MNGAAIEGISERLMQVRLELEGESNAVIFVAAYATTETAGEVDKEEVWTGWHSATLHGPAGETSFLNSGYQWPHKSGDGGWRER